MFQEISNLKFRVSQLFALYHLFSLTESAH